MREEVVRRGELLAAVEVHDDPEAADQRHLEPRPRRPVVERVQHDVRVARVRSEGLRREPVSQIRQVRRPEAWLSQERVPVHDGRRGVPVPCHHHAAFSPSPVSTVRGPPPHGRPTVIPSLDHSGRSLQDLINLVADLRGRGIGFTSLHADPDTATPGCRLVFHVFVALAEFIRELIDGVIHDNAPDSTAARRATLPGLRTVRRTPPVLDRQPGQHERRGEPRLPLAGPQPTRRPAAASLRSRRATQRPRCPSMPCLPPGHHGPPTSDAGGTWSRYASGDHTRSPAGWTPRGPGDS
ncbi:recombinase family protein [Streptomyces sp. NPDC045251]